MSTTMVITFTDDSTITLVDQPDIDYCNVSIIQPLGPDDALVTIGLEHVIKMLDHVSLNLDDDTVRGWNSDDGMEGDFYVGHYSPGSMGTIVIDEWPAVETDTHNHLGWDVDDYPLDDIVSVEVDGVNYITR